MTNKIVRSDGVTTLANIKSCVYTETVNADTDLRPGCVASAMIDVEVYGTQADAPSEGEALTYYQVDSEGNETLIGVFYAEPGVPSRITYRFTAYDAATALDADFSARLTELQGSFPMTVYALVSEACSVAGVALASASWPLSTQPVNAFYADGLTCRNILQYAAEIACRFVRCNTSGELVFDWYSASSTEVCPAKGTSANVTDDGHGNITFQNVTAADDGHGNLTLSGDITVTESNGDVSIVGTISYVPYKMGGLDYENYNTAALGIVSVQAVSEEGVNYMSPTAFTVDNGDGLEMYNFTAVASGGGLTFSGAIEAVDDSGGIVMEAVVTNDNTLSIANNLLLTEADGATLLAVANNIYTTLTALGQYRPCNISLFPFMNPFRAGDIVTVTDIQGVRFTTLVMRMNVSAAMAKLTSSGNRAYSTGGSNLSKAVASLNSSINQLTSLRIGSAEIKRAVIEALEANGINADEITVTGTLHSSDYDRADGSNYANAGIGIELDTKRIATPGFAIGPDGSVYAQSGTIAGFKLNKGQAYNYTVAVGNISFEDTGGAASTNYSVDTDNSNTVTAGENGTVVYSAAKASAGITLNKVRCRILDGGNTSSAWETPIGTVQYLDSGGNVIHTSTYALWYIAESSGLMITFTMNPTYLASASSVRIRITLANGDSCLLTRIYGTYSSMSAGSATTLKGASDTVYLGTDGISCGTGACITPDGHGAFTEVSADNIGDLSHLDTADKTSLVAAINELYALIH